MENNKKNLIVTLASDNYLDKAKQLFASVYFNAGWQGDYLLLAHEVKSEKLNWFIEKGIRILKTKALDNNTGPGNYPPVVLSKFYLFKEYFKKWDKIIFIDADVIVKASLDNLLNATSFSAPEVEHFKLKGEFTSDKIIIKELGLNRDYNLYSPALCSGVFAFDSNLIQADSFSILVSLYKKYKASCQYGEESIFNLYFYKKWNKLPVLYNYNPEHIRNFYGVKKNIPSFLIHFGWSTKPWNKDSEYYSKWEYNLKKAEEINLEKRLPAIKEISDKELKKIISYLSRKRIPRSIIIYLDRQIGRAGLAIKKINPNIYYKLSRKKNE